MPIGKMAMNRSALIGFYGPSKEWYWIEPVHKWALRRLTKRSLQRIIRSDLIVEARTIATGTKRPMILYHLARR